MNSIFWIVPIASVLALLFGWIFFKSMMTNSEGTDRMKEIAQHVRDGAMAYLRRQYKVVGMVFAILLVVFIILAFCGIPDRRFLLWIVWLPGYENSYICFCKDSPWSLSIIK
jgi:Na+/H+-translocating membrane pyrophosphatase